MSQSIKNFQVFYISGGRSADYVLLCVRVREKLENFDNWRWVIDEYLKSGFSNCHFTEKFKNDQTSTPFEELLAELNEKTDGQTLYQSLSEKVKADIDDLLTKLSKDNTMYRNCEPVTPRIPTAESSPRSLNDAISSVSLGQMCQKSPFFMSYWIFQIVSEEYSYVSCQSTQTDAEIQTELQVADTQDLLPDEYFKMKYVDQFIEHNKEFDLQFTALGK